MERKNRTILSDNILKFISILDNFEKEQMSKPFMERDLCPPETDPQLVVDCLCDLFLGEDWCVSMPISTEQANTMILDSILYKYSKAYRKYPKQYKEE